MTRTLPSRRPWVVCALCVLCLSLPASAATWTWQLPPARYKQLGQFERAQYDKAAALLTANNFNAAAVEFEKFKIQFADSPHLSYALFMRGYCLLQGKQRNTAVKVFQEVLDYFPDNVDDAAPALHFMGVAHLENGDTRKGLTAMKSLVENKAYQQHPLAAGALRRLADNYWNNKEPEQAVKYWRQTVRQFARTNAEEAAAANANLIACAIVNRDYAAYENFVLGEGAEDPAKKDDPATRRQLAETIWQRAFVLRQHPNSFDRKKEATEKDLADEGKAFYEYFKATKSWWEKSNDLPGYYERAAQAAMHFVKADKAERDRLLDEAVANIKTVADKSAADDRIDRLIDLCRDGKAPDRARYLIGLLADRTRALYKEYEVLASESKWDAAAKQLQEVEAAGQPAWADRAMNERARIYREILNKQPEAIALYERINKPPTTLWGIQECYKRMGKLDRALATLTEIENLFPPDAARAAWHKAVYLNESGDKKRAIAAAKHVAIAYKSAPEAGHAHTMLEANGIHLVGGESEAKDQ